jgi:ATP-dependent Clp protease protease subunit
VGDGARNIWGEDGIGGAPVPDDSNDPELRRQRLRILTVQANFAEDSWRWEEAKLKRRIYPLGGIDDAVAYDYRATIRRWLDYDPNREITIEISGPGGSIFSGLGIFDATAGFIAQGAIINTKVTGYAASMCGILLQMGVKRTITPNSYIMVHEASTLARGSQSASMLKDQNRLIEELQKRCLGILSSRSTLSLEEIEAKSDRRDWWLTSEEALSSGLVDEVSL